MAIMNFSVLLSLYKKENPFYLRQSLDSLFSQTLLPNEIILVKDGPLTEELEQVVSDYTAKYPILKVIPLVQNQGLGIALNEGLKHCAYDLVARMDTDDISKPNRFEKQIAVFQKCPDLDLVGSWIDEFENTPQEVISIRKVPQFHKDILRYCKMRSPINHVSVMFKKNAVISVGSYMHFPLLEDYYLWVRMLMNGAKFYNIQESLVYVRNSPDMFKRRGGWKYACDEVRFQKVMHQLGMISYWRLVANVMIRFPVRVMPNKPRELIYKWLLRKKE